MEAENFENSEAFFSSKLDDENLRVKIIGVGGAGGNALDRLQLDQLGSVGLVAVNTDAQALEACLISEKIMIGRNLTRGLSTGGQAEIGRAAATADIQRLQKAVDGTDLVFILAGLGGGTGSGAAPVIAEAAASQGALVIAFTTLPFSMEGTNRHKQAQDALANLRGSCDAVIPLPNDILLQQIDEDATVLDAFAQADHWMSRGVSSICSMLFTTGIINLDFVMLQKAFGNRGGRTLFGIGRGEGDEASKKAIADLQSCPLLHLPELPRKTDKLLVNVLCGADMGMNDINALLHDVTERFASRQETYIGAVVDDNLHQTVEICVIGTTDVGGRNAIHKYVNQSQHRQIASEAARPAKPVDIETETPVAAPVPQPGGVAVHQSKLQGKQETKTIPQKEFMFVSEEENRGYFEKTAQNLIDGVDVDVPTYLRKGLKLRL